MQHFLEAAAKKLGPRQHAVMVLDRAGWHTAKQLTWPNRITPLFLPPYSPKLNPAERLWLWFREVLYLPGGLVLALLPIVAVLAMAGWGILIWESRRSRR